MVRRRAVAEGSRLVAVAFRIDAVRVCNKRRTCAIRGACARSSGMRTRSSDVAARSSGNTEFDQRSAFECRRIGVKGLCVELQFTR